VLEESRLQDRPAIVREGSAREPSLSLPALLRREWEFLSAAENDASLRLYYDVLAMTIRNPDRFRIHPELLGEDWIETVAHLAKRLGITGARARSLGTLVLAGVRGLLLDLLASGDRKRVQRGFEDFAASLEAFIAGLPDPRSAPKRSTQRRTIRRRPVRRSRSPVSHGRD
jgi:hypothetical protein